MTIARSFGLSICLMVLLCVTHAGAQTPTSINGRIEPLPTTGVTHAIDYSLRMNNVCNVSSPLIRLRDVAAPVGPASSWWERAGGVIIGMMPIDGGEMVIERDRLIAAIDQDASIPKIAWTGADSVRVKMVAAHASKVDAPNVSMPVAGTVAHTNAVAPSAESSVVLSTATTPMRDASANDTTNLPALNSNDSDRVVRLIHFAIDRVDLSLRDSYDITIDPAQSALQNLADVRRVDRIEFLSTPTEGMILSKVFGVTSRHEIDQTIQVSFAARSMVVVPRDNLRRGQIIKAADLILVPAPRGFPIESAVKNIDDAVDMQVVNVLQKDRPISLSSITRPVIIERGDLVEVHVIGGGVTVATSARSLAKGAMGDLIAVETLEPRKKIIARVARSGLVEVFTRPPRVR
jgi:flagellar basal body P-ring formation protein FlgA